MQVDPKAVWSISYVSVAFFQVLKQNFIVYRSSTRQDCIFQFNNCDNQDLVGWIPIPAVTVPSNLQ